MTKSLKLQLVILHLQIEANWLQLHAVFTYMRVVSVFSRIAGIFLKCKTIPLNDNSFIKTVKNKSVYWLDNYFFSTKNTFICKDVENMWTWRASLYLCVEWQKAYSHVPEHVHKHTHTHSLASTCVAQAYHHCRVCVCACVFERCTCVSASKPHLQFTAASLAHCPNLCLLTLLFFFSFFFFSPLCIVLACSYCICLDWLVVWLYLLASEWGMG